MNAFRTSVLIASVMVASIAPMAQAQHSPYDAQINGWYVRYLGTNADRGGLIDHGAALQRGASPDNVEAAILGGPHYYERVGGNDHAFLAALYRDVAGTTCPPNEQYWHARLHTTGNRVIFAQEFLRAHRAGNLVQVQAQAPVVTEAYRPYYGVSHPAHRPVPVYAPVYRPAYPPTPVYRPAPYYPAYRPVPMPAPVYRPAYVAPAPAFGLSATFSQPGFGFGINFAR